MKRLLQFSLSFVLGLAVFLVIMYRVGSHAIIKALGLFFNLEGLAMVAITCLIVYFGCLKWKIILKNQGHKLGFFKLMPLWLLGSAITYLTPAALFGGEIFRIYFAQKKFPKIPSKTIMASVAADKILSATAFFTVMILGLFSFSFFGGFKYSWAVAICFSFALVFLTILLFFYYKKYKKQSALEWLFKTFGVRKSRFFNNKTAEDIFCAEQEVFQFFCLKSKVFWQALMVAFLSSVFFVFRAFVLVFFLTKGAHFFKAAAIYGFVSLAGLTPVPAALGALELTQGFAFAVLGFGFETGMVFSLVWRTADVMFAILGLFFLAKYGLGACKEKFLNLFGK